VLDLKELAEVFIRTKFHYPDDDDREDERGIRAIDGRAMDRADRERDLLRWLNWYKVLLFFPPDNSTKIAGEIIKFADERHETRLHQTKDSIIQEYERLKERIGQFAPVMRSGEPREVTSLTSKALWCCYPHDVPILDSHAAGALRVISRLSNMAPEPNPSEYACFADVWFQVYGEIQSVIDEADLGGHPYRVRVLDKLLWYLGQPTFDSP